MKKLAALAIVLLTACSPTEFFTWTTKTGSTYTVTTRAKSGPNDGGGNSFQVEAVCDGEPFWREGTPVNVDMAAPDSAGYFYSRVQCYSNRYPVGISVDRW